MLVERGMPKSAQRGRRRALKTLVLLMSPLALAFGLTVTVPLFYEMPLPPDGSGTMDSIAIWVAPDPDSSIVFVTDKSRDVLELHNPVSNTFIGRIGGTGTGPGQLTRPNGVAVADSVPYAGGLTAVVITVERDNDRVSIFSLPELQFLGHFGVGDLDKPYGIAIYWKDGQLQAWITSTGTSPDRVYVYNIVPDGQGLTGVLDYYFPVDAVLESLVIDPVSERALICDEGAGSDVMVYTLDGQLVDRFGHGRIVDDPEGIAIYDLGDGKGYIIVADQNASPTEFEVFDRQTYGWIGNFSGPTTGTDGVALCEKPLPNLPYGSFYALHSDDRVHVYSWADIATALNLSTIVPVELVSFAANVRNDHVELVWYTASEKNNYGFEIERRREGRDWERIGFVNGSGTTNRQNRYTFVDKALVFGTTYTYRLKQVDSDGAFGYSGTVEVDFAPAEFNLLRSYPNPFNASTVIEFALPHSGFVTIKVYNTRGEELETIVSEILTAGVHHVAWDARGYPSGVYFYRLLAGSVERTRKLSLVR